MVVDAVLSLEQDELDESLIGVKKIPGGGMQDSLLINGVSFKKTFTYAGAEQQPKSFVDPLILSLNVELELKAEKDNAEVRVDAVSDYQAIVDAEWEIIYRKLQDIEKTGAKVVLSKLPIGDLATQWFADRDIFCAGRVPAADLRRVVQAVGAPIQSTTSDIGREHLGTCGKFEERQIGSERYNVFEECPKAKTCTMLLRGGAEQFIEEVERSLHDAVMVVKRAVKNGEVVAGGGAIEVRNLAKIHMTLSMMMILCPDGPFCSHTKACAFYSGQASARPDRIRQGTRNHSPADLRQCRPRLDRYLKQAPHEACARGEMDRR
jgi:T-complex protein 1 subunit eta